MLSPEQERTLLLLESVRTSLNDDNKFIERCEYINELSGINKKHDFVDTYFEQAKELNKAMFYVLAQARDCTYAGNLSRTADHLDSFIELAERMFAMKKELLVQLEEIK